MKKGVKGLLSRIFAKLKAFWALRKRLRAKEMPTTLTNAKLKPIKLNKPVKPVEYHFIIGSSQFLLKDEPLEEILRERAQFYKRQGKEIDFWLQKSPKFVESEQLSDVRAKLLEDGLSEVELAAVISLKKSFITWLKLRVNHVIQGSFIAPDGDISSPLASNAPLE